ncbi:N-terminal ig-like domain of cellulase [Zunongwangia mangrovi]|uniref:N-terminal ig-like domain of cellulase n=1 Tax=Zunongwangia mangrovi TaxID=1334022 RepID=A0A1I1EBE9_9FLAO|nr:glycoside hydrolase family 9 protein [Zunongwangia mangrovi]SFB84357.1 N-terminal ig-like domain of cellulase [Zunongwangia mangrovi]
MKYFIYSFLFLASFTAISQTDSLGFHLNNLEYLEKNGANVMLAHDFYPESHQGGVGIIQNGLRVATNGDLRLQPTPGQWQPVPKVGTREIDQKTETISVRMQYPDSSKNRKGFNPIIYPDLEFSYTLKVKPAGKESFKIVVDLDRPLPKEWVGKVGMNIELFPGNLFGKSYYADNEFGIFNRQANGPGHTTKKGEYRLKPIAEAKTISIAPETPNLNLIIENLGGSKLQLLDGRAEHNNGWFIIRSLVPANKTKNAIEWLVTPKTEKSYTYDPVVQVSQVGYHSNQQKIAVIETDKKAKAESIDLYRVMQNGKSKLIKQETPQIWGDFLRYRYYQFDFSEIQEAGIYLIKYKDFKTSPFQISKTIYERDVWQPTLEYFLPEQMCHMRVNDRYKVWHGRCHLDDARMAPIDTNHFDGYLQGPETLTSYNPGEHVPNLNHGGWHDAGDYDLRIESQSQTVQGLARIYELFDIQYDNTTIDQKTQTVEILRPDGKADLLQQIEHGLLSIMGGYQSLGRFYRGIIVPTKRQYVLLGDPVNHSDNEVYDYRTLPDIPMGQKGAPDDRWVFTEKNKERSLQAAAALATSGRVMKNYNDTLARQALTIAKEEWERNASNPGIGTIELATELYHSTKYKKFLDYIIQHKSFIQQNFQETGWIVLSIYSMIPDRNFKEFLKTNSLSFLETVKEQGSKTPYGVPYEPDIWGAGWGIQNFGMKQYFFHAAFPQEFPSSYLLNALNFILGAHPGVNTSSFTSGVGSRSITQAYGPNRGEHSYVPGGIGSGTALIRPDFPELLEWPYLWQQTEYVLGGGTTDYLFLVIAANHLLKE